MEVVGSKAQAGTGIQALLQTDLNTSWLQRAIMDNGKDRQPAWSAMAGDWEAWQGLGQGGPGSQANPAPLCVPGLNSWEGAGALEPGQGSARLSVSPWEPSPGHWEHSPAPGQAGGICGSQGTAPTFRSPQTPSSLPCPRPGATSQ